MIPPLLSTSSAQGGVFLWDEGLPAPRVEAPGGAALTRERHPSMNDETLEVRAAPSHHQSSCAQILPAGT